MARARLGLQQAVNEILERHGKNDKRMSFRQAERLTGLSPATIGELAKGNARTPETVRRFARGLGEDEARLLLLGGFVPEEIETLTHAGRPLALLPQDGEGSSLLPEEVQIRMEPEEREWLGRFGRALAQMPPGRERELWKDNLRRNTELLETFVELLCRG
jgi:hypothetical protein